MQDFVRGAPTEVVPLLRHTHYFKIGGGLFTYHKQGGGGGRLVDTPLADDQAIVFLVKRKTMNTGNKPKAGSLADQLLDAAPASTSTEPTTLGYVPVGEPTALKLENFESKEPTQANDVEVPTEDLVPEAEKETPLKKGFEHELSQEDIDNNDLRAEGLSAGDIVYVPSDLEVAISDLQERLPNHKVTKVDGDQNEVFIIHNSTPEKAYEGTHIFTTLRNTATLVEGGSLKQSLSTPHFYYTGSNSALIEALTNFK